MYNIQHPDINASQSRLFITVSLRGISFTILDAANTFTSLVAYEFPANAKEADALSQISELFANEKILLQQFKRIYIIHAFAEAIMVPGELMPADNRQDILELVF